MRDPEFLPLAAKSLTMTRVTPKRRKRWDRMGAVLASCKWPRRNVKKGLGKSRLFVVLLLPSGNRRKEDKDDKGRKMKENQSSLSQIISFPHVHALQNARFVIAKADPRILRNLHNLRLRVALSMEPLCLHIRTP